ncbi:MAG: hypothetical protein RL440_684 [Bacteroidota bacterium]|jgi:hypothetical protein
MKYIFLLLLCGLFQVQLKAQFIETDEGKYFGSNISQADLDLLFVNNPNLDWLDFDYKDTTLTLPNFKTLDILAIQSEVLQKIVFPDTILELGLIDFNIPSLTSITEPVAPNLFQITLYASLDSLPNFICTSSELRLVDIKNYKDITWPDCMEERFVNGPFELSSCEILDAKDGNTISKIVSPDKVEGEVDLSVEDYVELQKSMKKSARRIGIIRRASGFLLAGVVFLIWAS